jgi:hypothetical protein
MEHVLQPTADPAWILAVDGYDPLRASRRTMKYWLIIADWRMTISPVYA